MRSKAQSYESGADSADDTDASIHALREIRAFLHTTTERDALSLLFTANGIPNQRAHGRAHERSHDE